MLNLVVQFQNYLSTNAVAEKYKQNCISEGRVLFIIRFYTLATNDESVKKSRNFLRSPLLLRLQCFFVPVSSLFVCINSYTFCNSLINLIYRLPKKKIRIEFCYCLLLKKQKCILFLFRNIQWQIVIVCTGVWLLVAKTSNKLEISDKLRYLSDYWKLYASKVKIASKAIIYLKRNYEDW